MRHFSKRKYKQWCKNTGYPYDIVNDSWATACDGNKVYGGVKDAYMHCIGSDGQWYLVAPDWIAKR